MIRRYARFAAFLGTAGLVGMLAWQPFGGVPAVLIGFDAGALVFFVSLIWLFHGATANTMRARSQANEPDHHLLLLLSMAIAAVTIAGIWAQFIAISALRADQKAPLIALATFSLAIVWLFANALGTIHYAHLWYLRGPDGKDTRGLDFPGPDLAPDYWDFAYFTAVLSMTFQVSDVEITTKPLRRLVLVHGLVAFLFNISVIALSVSLVSSVLGG
jgi:uncharacterized membrane protein